MYTIWYACLHTMGLLSLTYRMLGGRDDLIRKGGGGEGIMTLNNEVNRA